MPASRNKVYTQQEQLNHFDNLIKGWVTFYADSYRWNKLGR